METYIFKSKILPEERETHLNFDPETKSWILYSNISRHFNKAMRAGWTPIKEGRYEDGTIVDMTLTAPERGITIKTPKKREFSDEHKAKLLGSKINDLESIFDDED